MMKPFYWFARTLTKACVRLMYGHKIYGLEHFFPGRGILAPNHASFLDPPLVGVSWPEEVSFLARKTLFSSPLFSILIRQLNSYPIDGKNLNLQALKQICLLLQENKKIVVFPEGIRSEQGLLGPIKSGIGMIALRSQSPIIPVYIHGTYDVWNRFRSLPRFSGKTACVFGTPIDWKKYSELDKKAAQEALAMDVKLAIEKLKIWFDKGAVGIPP